MREAIRRAILCLSSLTSGAFAQGWNFEPILAPAPDVGWNVKCVVDANGRVTAACYQSPPSGGGLYVATRDPVSGQWTRIDRRGLSDDLSGGFSDLLVDREQRPVVVFYRPNPPGPVFATRVGDGWDVRAMELEGGAGFDAEFDSLGRLHVAYHNTSERMLKHSWLDAGVWHHENVVGNDTFLLANVSEAMVLGPGDVPHLTWQINSTRQMQHTTREGGNWVTRTIGVGLGFSLALDSQGRLAMAYANNDIGPEAGQYFAVFSNGAWQSSRLSTGSSFDPGSLAFDASGSPMVLYLAQGNSDSVSLATRATNGAWSSQLVTSWSDNRYSGPEQAFLTFANGQSHIVFADSGIGFHYGRRGESTLPPSVEIASPGQLSTTCSAVAIRGSVRAATPAVSYRLEYARSGNGPWNLVAAGSGPITNEVIGTLQPEGLEDGFLFLRLTATAASVSNSAVQMVQISRGVRDMWILSPFSGQVVGGIVPFQGTCASTLPLLYGGSCAFQYASAPDFSVYLPFRDSGPVGPAVNSWLAQWVTTSQGITWVPDGEYRIQMSGADSCGNQRSVFTDLTVDNTPPSARIDSPARGSRVSGLVDITGRAWDTNFAYWILEVSGDGIDGWRVIAQDQAPPVAGRLGSLDTRELGAGVYLLRLTAFDRAIVNGGVSGPYGGHRTEDIATIVVGCPADVDDGTGLGSPDGGVTIDDLLYFLQQYQGGC